MMDNEGKTLRYKRLELLVNEGFALGEALKSFFCGYNKVTARCVFQKGLGGTFGLDENILNAKNGKMQSRKVKVLNINKFLNIALNLTGLGDLLGLRRLRVAIVLLAAMLSLNALAAPTPEPTPTPTPIPETVVYPGPRDTVAYSISGGYFTRVFGYPSGSGDPGATIRSAWEINGVNFNLAPDLPSYDCGYAYTISDSDIPANGISALTGASGNYCMGSAEIYTNTITTLQTGQTYYLKIGTDGSQQSTAITVTSNTPVVFHVICKVYHISNHVSNFSTPGGNITLWGWFVIVSYFQIGSNIYLRQALSLPWTGTGGGSNNSTVTGYIARNGTSGSYTSNIISPIYTGSPYEVKVIKQGASTKTTADPVITANNLFKKLGDAIPTTIFNGTEWTEGVTVRSGITNTLFTKTGGTWNYNSTVVDQTAAANRVTNDGTNFTGIGRRQHTIKATDNQDPTVAWTPPVAATTATATRWITVKADAAPSITAKFAAGATDENGNSIAGNNYTSSSWTNQSIDITVSGIYAGYWLSRAIKDNVTAVTGATNAAAVTHSLTTNSTTAGYSMRGVLVADGTGQDTCELTPRTTAIVVKIDKDNPTPAGSVNTSTGVVTVTSTDGLSGINTSRTAVAWVQKGRSAPSMNAYVPLSSIAHIPAGVWDVYLREYDNATNMAYTIIYSGQIGDIPFPDNISGAACIGTPPVMDWTITEARSIGYVSTYTPALVGDLYGSDKPEIVVGSGHHTTNTQGNPVGVVYHYFDSVAVFDGDTKVMNRFKLITRANPFAPGVIAIAKVKKNGVQTSLIVVAEADHKLRAYNTSGVLQWTSHGATTAWVDSLWTYEKPCDASANSFNDNCSEAVCVGFADFDGDSITEVYAGNKVFDATTGLLLCNGGANGNKGMTRAHSVNYGTSATTDNHRGKIMQTVAADVIGDEHPELCAGGCVYSVTKSGSTWTMTPATQFEDFVPNGLGQLLAFPCDGLTQVADINEDGKLDIIVELWVTPDHHIGNPANPVSETGWDAYTQCVIFAWTPSQTNPVTNGQLASITINNARLIGIPMIGNIDSDSRPEIVFITSDDNTSGSLTNKKIYALKYNNTTTFNIFWTYQHTDPSGVTGMTLFDFNQDGKAEIVYRDQTHLRIIDGSTTSPSNLNTFPCNSGTGFEYPVVADIDNDGQAEILIAGPAISANPAQQYSGPLRIFEAPATGKWAPARPVWNQYAYNALNINSDLTVPFATISPAMFFDGPDGAPGGGDDLQPFNNFLQQQTTLNSKGQPLWLLPDLEIVPGSFRTAQYAVGDSIVLYLKVTNTGDAAVEPVWHIAAYKNSVSTGNYLFTENMNVEVLPGDTLDVKIRIAPYSSRLPMNSLILRLNNNNTAGYEITECNYSLQDYDGALLAAFNDRISTYSNKTIVIDETLNDSIPAGGYTVTTPATTAHGTVTVLPDNRIQYTPATGYNGIDSLQYTINQAGNTATAKVYIVVEKPLAEQFFACQNAVVTIGMNAATGVQHFWFTVQTGGTTINNPATTSKDTLHVTKTSAAQQVWWLEPRYNGMTFPRIQVILSMSDNCGGTSPVGCAATGQLLFREDFGGNATTDPAIKACPALTTISSHYTCYDGAGQLNGACYTVRKVSGAHNGGATVWYTPDDHTYPGDATRGYLLQVNSDADKGQFYEYQINNLCEGTKLYFSEWLTSIVVPASTYVDKVNQIIQLEDPSGNVLAQYYTGNLPDASSAWKLYGFEFTVPDGVSSILMRIINNSTGTSGNDFVLDDIEIRLCAPSVYLTSENGASSVDYFCPSDGITLSATYTDDGTFGLNLAFQWQYSADSITWTDCTGAGSSGTDTDGSLTNAETAFTVANAGFYRLIVSNPANINSAVCRSVSNGLHIKHRPNPEYISTVAQHYYPGTGADSLVITIKYTNFGLGDFTAPFYLTVYKNAVGNALKQTFSNPSIIHAGDTVTASYRITNFLAGGWTAATFTGLVVRLNDRGDTFNAQKVCDSTRRDGYLVPLIASNDVLTVSPGCDNDTLIDVLANDLLDGCTAANVVITVTNTPKWGTATVSPDNKIRYHSGYTVNSALALPPPDTVRYRITCGADIADAYVVVPLSYGNSSFVDDIWYFGRNSAGIRFVDNGSGYVATDASGQSIVSTGENALVIASPFCAGQVIFYVDYNRVVNNQHVVMPSGTISGSNSTADGYAACYLGNNRYMLFSITGAYGQARALVYYIVDMNADNGRGNVVAGPTTIEAAGSNSDGTNSRMSESLELIPVPGTTNQYWLLYAYENGTITASCSDQIRVRKITITSAVPSVGGVTATAVKNNYVSYSFVSTKSGNRVAVINSNGSFDVYDFNTTTGALTRHGTGITGMSTGSSYGGCFSPDGNSLYVASYTGASPNLPAMLQYTVTGTSITLNTTAGTLKYWNSANGTSGTAYSRGGGMKLGPDDKIYVMNMGPSTTMPSTRVGVLSNPNSTTTTMASRYNASGVTMANLTDGNYTGLQFSTGLTKPAIMPCNENTSPVTVPDTVTVCMTDNRDSVMFNVLRNDYDFENNTIYLTSAKLVNTADASLATVSVISADSLVKLKLTAAGIAAITTGKEFLIEYSVKDNGAPASQCATGQAVVIINRLKAATDRNRTIINTPVATAILLNDTMTCACTPTVTVRTAPLHGGAVVQGDSIVYTPALDFIGLDSLVYRIACGTDYSEAKVYLVVHEKPDNISDEDCYVLPPNMLWSFREINRSTQQVSAVAPLVAGDVDGDGNIETLALAAPAAFHTAATTLYIFDHNLQVKYTVTLTGGVHIVQGGISIADVNRDGKAEIFACTMDGYLRKYSWNGTTFTQSGAVQHQTPITNNYIFCQPMITDFNGNGDPEIVVLDKVYDAKTLTLLVNGNFRNGTNHLGYGSLHAASDNSTYRQASVMAIGDIDNDGFPEVVAGGMAYKVRISSQTSTSGNSFTLYKSASTAGHAEVGDGATALADIDCDGYLDAIVSRRTGAATAGTAALYVWNPRTGAVMNVNPITNLHAYKQDAQWGAMGPSVPFVGDIDGNGKPEIALVSHTDGSAYKGTNSGVLTAYLFRNDSLIVKWQKPNDDYSAATTLTMFDFDQNGSMELVYRDVSHLRILNGADGNDIITPVVCTSATGIEYPVVVDYNNDGAAEILVTGGITAGVDVEVGYLRVFGSDGTLWAPSRHVWHQFSYNPVYINNDLTVPSYPLNPALYFPNGKQPYNNFLQQATVFNADGDEVWLSPDLVYNTSTSAITREGDSVKVYICVENQGDAAIGKPVYFSFYRDSVSLASLIRADSINAMLSPGDDTCVTRYVRIQPPFTDLVLRINDNGVKYPYQPECHYEDSIVSRNPALSAYMKKRAWLNAEPDNRNGTYPNPVAVLNGDVITYRITALNANPVTGGSMTVSDTLPAYLNYIAGTGSPTPSETTYGTTPPRKVLTFNFSALTPYSTHTAEFKAETAPGANASQPLFVNRAWVTVSDTLNVPTDSATYHQGAGIAVVTFSASAGGLIIAPEPQAVDYRTSPRSESLLIVPDSGYVFAGWSHPAYISLKGIEVPATDGVFNLDTLLIYGNVELTAVFTKAENLNKVPNLVKVEDDTEAFTHKIWSSGSELFVRTVSDNAVLRIYTPEGVLIQQHTILPKGIAKYKLPRGIYIANINGGIGSKVLIE